MSLWDEVRNHLLHDPKIERDRSAPADLELQVATAIVLLEAAHGDETYAWSEHRAISKGLRRAFGLGRREVQSVLARAEEIRPPVVRLADVTGLLNERLDREQRLEVARLVWQVIGADGVIEDWERAFADHIAVAVGLTPEEAQGTGDRPPTRP